MNAPVHHHALVPGSGNTVAWKGTTRLFVNFDFVAFSSDDRVDRRGSPFRAATLAEACGKNEKMLADRL
jgi:hypothetical protein